MASQKFERTYGSRILKRMRVSPGLNILVVDDDVQCLGSLGDFLEHEGHTIRKATCGQEALDVARGLRRQNRLLELSILDFHVPDMSGLETFERLSTLQPGLAAIFITGDVSDSMEDTILAAGGLALVRKPIDLCRMRHVIEAYRAQLPGSF